jgi:hypothetical protein
VAQTTYTFVRECKNDEKKKNCDTNRCFTSFKGVGCIYKNRKSWVWWCTLVILALGRLRVEDQKFDGQCGLHSETLPHTYKNNTTKTTPPCPQQPQANNN